MLFPTTPGFKGHRNNTAINFYTWRLSLNRNIITKDDFNSLLTVTNNRFFFTTVKTREAIILETNVILSLFKRWNGTNHVSSAVCCCKMKPLEIPHQVWIFFQEKLHKIAMFIHRTVLKDFKSLWYIWTLRW
jgi:hypothetical protein